MLKYRLKESSDCQGILWEIQVKYPFIPFWFRKSVYVTSEVADYMLKQLRLKQQFYKARKHD